MCEFLKDCYWQFAWKLVFPAPHRGEAPPGEQNIKTQRATDSQYGCCGYWNLRPLVRTCEAIVLAAVRQVCGLKGPEDLRLVLRKQVLKNYIYHEKWMKKEHS